MGSQDRRLVVKSRYDFANYRYKIKGKEYTREKAIDMILDVLDVKAMTINELSEMFEIDGQPISNLIKVMRENNLIKNTKLRRNGHYLFKSHNDCLLAKMLYPSANEIEQKFKIKGSIKRKVEDAPIVSYNNKYNTFNYSNHYLNSIYYSDGD